MSGVMNPFDTLFGVVINRRSSRRALMLPSFEATKPRSYMRRPASTISARICSSRRVLIEKESDSRSHGDTKSGRSYRCKPPRFRAVVATSQRSRGAIFGAAFFGTEVVGRTAGAQRQRGPRRNEG